MLLLKPTENFADRYILVERIGYGGFSEVWKVKRESGFVQALKIFSLLDEEGLSIAREEFERVFNLNHDRLLKASDYGVYEGHPYLVLPYCSKGSAMKQVGKLDEKGIAKVMLDISSALHFLHNSEDPIIHQDIKPDNFLVDDNGNFLLADFGISKKLRKSLTQQALSNRETSVYIGNRSSGTTPPSYRPPETFSTDFDKRKPIIASDIWSFGVALYELSTNDLPFGDYGGLIQKKGADIPNLPKNQFSEGLNAVLHWCLAPDPWNRPSAEKLVQLASNYLDNGEWTIKSKSTSSIGNRKLNTLQLVGGGIITFLLIGLLGYFLIPRNSIRSKSSAYEEDSTYVNEPRMVVADTLPSTSRGAVLLEEPASPEVEEVAADVSVSIPTHPHTNVSPGLIPAREGQEKVQANLAGKTSEMQTSTNFSSNSIPGSIDESETKPREGLEEDLDSSSVNLLVNPTITKEIDTQRTESISILKSDKKEGSNNLTLIPSFNKKVINGFLNKKTTIYIRSIAEVNSDNPTDEHKRISLEVDRPVMLGTYELVKKGTIINGKVTKVSPSGIRAPEIWIDLDQLPLETGIKISLENMRLKAKGNDRNQPKVIYPREVYYIDFYPRDERYLRMYLRDAFSN